jgi:hypothetical protein
VRDPRRGDREVVHRRGGAAPLRTGPADHAGATGLMYRGEARKKCRRGQHKQIGSMCAHKKRTTNIYMCIVHMARYAADIN